MSTIDPSTIDPSKPTAGTALTADVRGNEQATQDNFTAAKNDIEALESSTSAHYAAGNPHTDSASLTDLNNHKASGGAEHPAATTLLAGFMSATDKTKLDALPADAAAGTLKDVQQNGAGVTSGDTTLDFRATGDASVQVTSQAGNVTRVTIDASAGAGGGGIGKGTPFVVGDLMEASSSVGDGEAVTSGLQATAVASHIASTSNPHSVTAAQVGALTAVVEDTAPILGGNLEMKGAWILATRADDSVQGVLTALNSVPGSALVYSDGVNPWETSDGAVAVLAGQVEVYGLPIMVELKHGNAQGRDVMVGAGGQLYAVDPPPPGWSDPQTSTADQSLGTGSGVGSWEPAAGAGGGLFRHDIVQDLSIGDVVTLNCEIYVVHGKDGDPTDLHDKNTSIEIGFGLNGVHPTVAEAKVSIGPYFTGRVTFGFRHVLTTGVTASDKLDVYFRRGGGNDSASNPWIYYTGSGATPHESLLTTPGAGGAGGGDVIQGTVGNDLDLLQWDDATGKVAGSSGIPKSDVARIGSVNTFTALNRFNANSTIDVDSSTNESAIRQLPSDGVADQRAFATRASGGDYLIEPTNDAGVPIPAGRLTLSHQGGGQYGAPTGGTPGTRGHINAEGLAINNAPVVGTGAPSVLGTDVGITGTGVIHSSASGDYTPELDKAQYASITGSSALTINPPTALVGHQSIYFSSGVTPTLGAFTIVSGAPVAGVQTLEVARYPDGATRASWVPGA